jgi:hypothetical protein
VREAEAGRWRVAGGAGMTYSEHFLANIKVAARCALLAVFHALHAIIPAKITSHEYWRIK